ncbi:sugar efflux transporter [Mammaliicoccus sp. Dog046]|uniref:sugar efflux transporter n=1 Tax=Mammaliicoccus sp. Dog046 TaxID=3034233 RepID=UPI002B259456|nr:sugar efflux transporter [Mammaliicoccus sp. Dog046]WQK85900.1 sugar efflux transporter [Mammaliicoccus sp. Dog046]
MFFKLFQIKNYKLFTLNMGLLGMAMAITVPFLVLYATQHLGMTKFQYGILMALAATASFTVNSIIARFSDSGKINRKHLIITALIMGAICFSIYFYIHTIILFILLYAMFQGLAAPAMPQMYASARESINESDYKDRSIFANTVLRSTFSLGFLFGPLIGTLLLRSFDYDGLFGGTVALFLTVLILFIIFYKEPIKVINHAMGKFPERKAPNLFAEPTLMIPFLAFILLHVGQWMYTLNMPLYVTEYLKDDESNVGYLASLCAGLEVPFMIILGIIASKFKTKTLLMVGSIFGFGYYFSIGVFDNFIAMLIGQLALAFFLAILLGLGISYFQDILPDFPGYASTLFANAMVIGQLGGNLLGGLMSDIVGLGNVFFVSALSVAIGFVLLIFTIEHTKDKETQTS